MQNTFLEMCVNATAQIEFQIVVYHNKTRNTDATSTQFASRDCSMKHGCITYILLSSLQFAAVGIYWKHAPSVRGYGMDTCQHCY